MKGQDVAFVFVAATKTNANAKKERGRTGLCVPA